MGQDFGRLRHKYMRLNCLLLRGEQQLSWQRVCKVEVSSECHEPMFFLLQLPFPHSWCKGQCEKPYQTMLPHGAQCNDGRQVQPARTHVATVGRCNVKTDDESDECRWI